MENFSINRDGEIDPDFQRQQQVQAIKQVGTSALMDVQRISRPLSRALVAGLGNVVTPVMLDVHDSLHGSHLRDEWFERKHELATAAMREEVGL